MPKFFFHSLEDEVGSQDDADWLDFPDAEAACRAADHAIREQALEQAGPGKETIIVRDEGGSVVIKEELEVRAVTGKPKRD